ncbi:hypothetical protein JKP88DRAFT_321022 [Tribonema minus]|uniref:Uncharacterized protein n=1 Tax=Tribonema minus TaxID=303371 RepID=A0A836CDG6_9STRA|nr:hypothetical protein JKP88DRAFT_321022 [Tribonema minus]
MADARFATRSGQVGSGYDDDDYLSLFGQHDRVIAFDQDKRMTVSPCGGCDENGFIHCGLLLVDAQGSRSSNGLFYLAWLDRWYPVLLLHRMANGIYVAGLDSEKEAWAVLSSRLNSGDGGFFALPIGCATPDPETIQSLADSLDGDLDREVVCNPTEMDPDTDTNCVLFTVRAAHALGISTDKVTAFAVTQAQRNLAIGAVSNSLDIGAIVRATVASGSVAGLVSHLPAALALSEATATDSDSYNDGEQTDAYSESSDCESGNDSYNDDACSDADSDSSYCESDNDSSDDCSSSETRDADSDSSNCECDNHLSYSDGEQTDADADSNDCESDNDSGDDCSSSD